MNGRCALLQAATAVTVLGSLAGCRGFPGGTAEAGKPDTSAAALAGVPLAIHVDAHGHQLVFELPPVDLPAHSAHHAIQQPPPAVGYMPIAAWLHGYSVDLVDSTGHALPRLLLQHMSLIVPDRRELFSPIMQRIGGAGQETAPVNLPRFVGYPIHRGEPVLLVGAFDNPTDSSYTGVRLRVHIPYVPADTWLRPIRVFPFYMDVMPPAGQHAYDLPPGRSRRSWEGEPAVSGRILGLGGHLHRYAVALELTDVSTGKVIWETRPTKSPDGNITSMPQDPVWRHLGIPIVKGIKYRLTAIYDNPTTHTIPDGAMGALGGVMIPARNSLWPAVDTTDATFQQDVAWTHRQISGTSTHMRMGS
jgi:hypothetical protein